MAKQPDDPGLNRPDEASADLDQDTWDASNEEVSAEELSRRVLELAEEKRKKGEG